MLSMSCADVCSFQRSVSATKLTSQGSKFSGGVRAVAPAERQLPGPRVLPAVSPRNVLNRKSDKGLRGWRSPRRAESLCTLRSSPFTAPAGAKRSARWPTRNPSTRPSVSCKAFRSSGAGRRRAFPFVSFALQVAFFYFLFKGGAIGGVLKVILWMMLITPVVIWLLIFFGSRLMAPGKCPNCGLQFSAARGKKQFKCPSCQTLIEVDKSTRQFVRAAPSWEQTGAAGAGAYGAGSQPGAGGNAGGAQQGTKDTGTNGRAGGAVDIIDVEVLDIKDVNERN
mmetsp:Transcript_19627/g.42899  ORF Transcript_19627/g.42899 Transcript_19627/m.42899 type:complete len:281 (+) Transcript_19627:194-1036(+)